MFIKIPSTVSEVTKKVMNDFNTLNDKDFFYKYSCSKNTYYERVKKYGDPYMNSPLAKIGKMLNKLIK